MAAGSFDFHVRLCYSYLAGIKTRVSSCETSRMSQGLRAETWRIAVRVARFRRQLHRYLQNADLVFPENKPLMVDLTDELRSLVPRLADAVV